MLVEIVAESTQLSPLERVSLLRGALALTVVLYGPWLLLMLWIVKKVKSTRMGMDTKNAPPMRRWVLYACGLILMVDVVLLCASTSSTEVFGKGYFRKIPCYCLIASPLALVYQRRFHRQSTHAPKEAL